MTCPNCGQQYEYADNCPYCKFDVTLYAETIRMSNSLYNKGLVKAQVSDLSGAMECLNKSVAINKNNTHARNLLGLIQYEFGYIGEALKNWVISCGLQKEDNLATSYIESIQKNARTLERLNDSIRIYNQALNDIGQKSDDMAIIKLKQAIDINPKFVDALNLLTLCYLMQNDKAKAKATAERVLAIDSNNVLALRYYGEINPGARPGVSIGKTSRKKTSVDTQQPSYKKVVLQDRRSSNFHVEGILCLVIGVLLTLGVMLVLVNPAIARTQTNQIEDMQSRLTQAQQAHETTIAEKEDTINLLQSQIEEYAQDAESLSNRYDELDRSISVFAASELLRDGRIREAVDTISSVNVDGLRQDVANLFWEIVFEAYPQLANQYYLEGFAAYHALDFEKARVDFERAYRYAQYIDDPVLMGNILYYLAWTYSRDIDLELAVIYFERFIEEFPTHRYINHARNQLAAITG